MIDFSLFILKKQIITLHGKKALISKRLNKNKHKNFTLLILVYTLGFTLVFFNVYLAMVCFFLIGISKLIELKQNALFFHKKRNPEHIKVS